MKLYKFRSLVKPEHTLDILLNQRLFCSRYVELNDPFEGQFTSLIDLRPEDKLKHPLLANVESLPVVRSIADVLPELADEPRICSLSSTFSDVRLWSFYADSHRGVAIEIELPDSSPFLHRIEYFDRLPHFKSATILGAPTTMDLLTRKTKHWSYEAEFRLLIKNSYFDIQGKITKVIVGARIGDINKRMLAAVCKGSVTLSSAHLDPYVVDVQIFDPA